MKPLIWRLCKHCYYLFIVQPRFSGFVYSLFGFSFVPITTAETSKVDWSLADGHGYVFNRSHIAACLNLQYYLWKEAVQFVAHPSIQLSNESVIADVATGTGAWLLDVARAFRKLNSTASIMTCVKPLIKVGYLQMCP